MSPGKGTEGESMTVADNIEKAVRMIQIRGANPDERHFVVDCDASSSRVHWMEGIAPCLIKARYRGHYVTSKKGRFSLL